MAQGEGGGGGLFVCWLLNVPGRGWGWGEGGGGRLGDPVQVVENCGLMEEG